ncbi:hypothetical protein D3C85_666380 [compost metagenome]
MGQALLQVVEREGGDLLGGRHGFTLVAAGQQTRGLNAEGAARGGHLLSDDLREEGLDLFERRGAQAGIGQIGGEHLHLQLQIGGAGRAGQLIGVAVDGEARAIDLAREDAAQLVGGQLAETALREDHRGEHLRGEAVGRQAFFADAGANRNQNLLVLERRGLDDQAHPVGEADDRGADGVDLGAAGGRRGGAEVGIRPLKFGLRGAGCDRHGATGLQGGGDAGLAAFDGFGRDHQGERALTLEHRLDGGVDLGGLQILHPGFKQGQVGGGGREDPIVVSRAEQSIGQARRAAGRGGLNGVFQRRAVVGDFAIQFGLGDPELHQAALLLIDGFQRARQAARIEVGRDGADVDAVEQTAAAGAGGDEGRVVGAGHLAQPAVQDGQTQVLQQAVATFGGGVWVEIGVADPVQLD